MLEALSSAGAALAQPAAIGFLIFGTFLGYIFGIMPGLNAITAIAISLPLIYGMNPILAMYYLAGIMGAVSTGGSITAILINTPGTAGNAATCLDGYPMTQKGQANRALSISAFSGMLGCLFGLVILVALVPIIRVMIMSFSPPEFFMLCLMGLAVVGVAVKGDLVKGLASVCVGVLLSFLGFHYMTGLDRFTFGMEYLQDGIQLVPFFIGLFAMGEMFSLINAGQLSVSQVKVTTHGQRMQGVRDTLKYWQCLIRSSVIGVIIGIIPGIGSAVANWVSYLFARQFSKTPDKFGTGHPEGIIASETGITAKDGGALLPTLAFGIPGSAEMAVLLGAFILVGLVPGPSILLDHMDIMYVLIFGLVISAAIVNTLTMFLASHFAKVTAVNVSYLVPIVIVLSFLGSYAIRGSVMDVAAAAFFGIVGFVMKRTGFPIIPMIIGYVLGRMSENWFLQSLAISDTGFAIFFTRPISLVLFIISIAILVFPFIRRTQPSFGGAK